MSIDVERDGHVAVITINRPEARNALDPEHNEALGAAVAGFEADDDPVSYTHLTLPTSDLV